VCWHMMCTPSLFDPGVRAGRCRQEEEERTRKRREADEKREHQLWASRGGGRPGPSAHLRSPPQAAGGLGLAQLGIRREDWGEQQLRTELRALSVRQLQRRAMEFDDGSDVHEGWRRAVALSASAPPQLAEEDDPKEKDALVALVLQLQTNAEQVDEAARQQRRQQLQSPPLSVSVRRPAPVPKKRLDATLERLSSPLRSPPAAHAALSSPTERRKKTAAARPAQAWRPVGIADKGARGGAQPQQPPPPRRRSRRSIGTLRGQPGESAPEDGVARRQSRHAAWPAAQAVVSPSPAPRRPSGSSQEAQGQGQGGSAPAVSALTERRASAARLGSPTGGGAKPAAAAAAAAARRVGSQRSAPVASASTASSAPVAPLPSPSPSPVRGVC
jgi:hypothetical protein